jgi:hypothetical protein
MNSFQLLDINLAKPSFFMIINERNGSGKFHFLRFMIKELNIHKLFDYRIMISNTAWEKDSFNYIPEKYIFEDFNENIIKNMIKIQKDNLAKGIQKKAFLIYSRFYVYYLQHWPHDANTHISLLYQYIKEELRRTSHLKVLYLQFDNCGKDNKNKYIIIFCIIEVKRYLFAFLCVIVKWK